MCGMPLTWTALDPPGAALQPKRRRILLAWIGLVPVYLIVMSIYWTNHVLITYSKYPLNVKIAVKVSGNILLFCSPVLLLWNALWQADKLANVLRVFSFVQSQFTDSLRSTDGH